MKLNPLCLCVILFSVASCQTTESEDYLIPNGFSGRVTIIFNQKDGIPVKYGGGKRIYEIPASGILLTEFNDEYGWVNRHYYYMDSTGKKTSLEIFHNNKVFTDNADKIKI